LTPPPKAVTFPVNESREAWIEPKRLGRSDVRSFANKGMMPTTGIAARARKYDPTGSIWDGKSSIGS
jgi:hypothetical protein